MDSVVQSHSGFVISSAEIYRRKAAFDRLAVSTTVMSAIFSADSIAAHFPASILGILALAFLFLISRAALASSFHRFIRTTWTISSTSLIRSGEWFRDEYPLARIRHVRTKRTVAGNIREIRLGLDGGRSVYVNGIDDFESFRKELLAGCPRVKTDSQLHEVIAFDHSLFYVVLGAVLGLLISLAVRVVRQAPNLDVRYIYFPVAAFLLAVGVYWLRAKPVCGRYGEHRAVLDRVIGLGVICLGAGAALMGLFL